MRLIIFGDSFAHPHKADYVWTNKITERLKATQQINYANNGASIEYCLFKLDHYIKNDYDVDDKIIFFITNPTRVPLVDNDYVPDWASLSSAYDVVKGENRQDRTVDHVKEHSAYYKTHVTFTNPQQSEYKFYTALSALNTINNDTLALFSFNKLHKSILNLQWRNNLIISQTIGYEIAGNEIQGNIESINDLYNDFRAHHMSEINHNIFVDSIVNSFKQRKDCFDINNFKQNILNKEKLQLQQSDWSNWFNRFIG